MINVALRRLASSNLGPESALSKEDDSFGQGITAKMIWGADVYLRLPKSASAKNLITS
jgi:hypothetical protein